ncbi:flavin-dependent oxidoreductase [Hydrogenophaga sp.]|jgi:2-polyprenyl-6-methoxyphenol hydroxylase-like FAD-dependent oxidoreductase|uniref:flavin-dependent oxidoreductase n=2 Tax=Hydrogenophaga sp. TaxID=1904254 RepID=UPI0025BED783|nr:flavin-dependent oxidoreductase [Hydrogenophaga sp.]MDO9135924.1 flavin-dependent oxidoreductase [Hydrogenophaga sp.]MDO9506174.1 flavin-dependent oxidoreductase [Hydrogenophaga sp.]MDP2986548.1 flavin-dependent oxidoreductase [Hydrogenophaga sp.]MDP3627376.1 flavin-dependent oxidoreductase [Hydrogenophaga sp.]MDZ4281083.1 flavin-dependent oxidoreductase [Hydrogenophaga sp.]
MSEQTAIAVVGGGIAGLAFALALHQRGIACDVYEGVAEVKELGVGITLLPHAMQELTALGLLPQLEAVGIENRESVFFNRFGQRVYGEARGRHAGYAVPELGIHRGKLHRILFEAALQRLGPQHVHTGFRCTGLAQDADGVTLSFADNAQGPVASVRALWVVACDGVNSAIRKHFFPDDRVCYGGINTWRGTTVHKPILDGKSYIRVGSIDTGKMVIYPIVDNVDGQGNQLINWVAEIRDSEARMNDWNRPGRAEDFLPTFADWRFDWLDVPALISSAEHVFEYPMVDKDALPRWSFERVTLMGDAAHPMYPRGSNGSAQALIDARTLADEIEAEHDAGGDLRAALQRYQDARLPATARVVETNRTLPPDFIIMKADELSGGKPFDNIDDLISQDELRAISDNYKQIAGFALKA